MKYETIYTDFKNLFPEEKEYFSTCEKNSVIGDDGDDIPHMSFEYLSCLSSTDF